MPAFNKRGAAAHVPNTDPIQSSAQLLTGPKGAQAWARTPKSELFLLATTSFFGQDKFYESAAKADSRFVALVHEVTRADPAWMLDFVFWLRNDANIRTAAVVAGVEGCKAVLDLNMSGPVPEGSQQGIARQLAKAGISRPDEVGEAAAYWVSKYGRNLPKPVKHALADRLSEFNEFQVLKYDSDKAAFKLADLIYLTHPKATSPAQADLFGWVLASKKVPMAAPDSLPMIQNRQMLMGTKVAVRRALLDPVTLKSAGMTWESLAGWLQGPLDARAWEAIIPSMGYMALLRNLRNFSQAGVSQNILNGVAARLASPVEVAKSRQLPMRFFSAVRAQESYVWHSALSQALDASLVNVPRLEGRTLVLVDTSGSMNAEMSEHGTLKRWDVASMFGIALATTSPGVELHSYSSEGWANVATKEFTVAKGADTLSQLVRWAKDYNIGGGTPTAEALRKLYRGHDRVILLTDEGHDYGQLAVTDAIPADKHLFTFNLAGYKPAGTPNSGFRHTFGGLNDQAFKLVKLTEEGSAGRWPWISSKENNV